MLKSSRTFISHLMKSFPFQNQIPFKYCAAVDEKKAFKMTDTLSEFDENFKPISHGSPRPLQALASMKVALNIWLTKFNEFYPSTNHYYIEIDKLDFNTEISITVPLKIKKMIDANFQLIVWELHKWYAYIVQVQNNLTCDQIYTRLNLVSFGGNGTVHFKDTIANFLDDDSLHTVTRFEMACVNCVAEKFDIFWPLVSHTFSVDNLKFDDDFMMYYWICRKEGELDRIPLKEFSSIERLMIDKCRRKCNHLAIEYFLTLLNPDDRLVQLEKLLNPDDFDIFLITELFQSEAERIFTCLFPNIDGPLQRQILDKYTTHVLYAFVSALKPVENVVQCFLYLKDVISTVWYCHKVIIKFIHYADQSSFGPLFGSSQNEKRYWYKYIEITLEQIWLNTPSHLKAYALENLSTILEEYNKKNDQRGSLDFGRDIRFLSAVLSDANVQLRNSIWNDYWPCWICGTSPSQFEELMELCLMETEPIEEFKNTFPHTEEFQRYCSRLICGGYFIELDELLGSLYSTHNLVLNVKKQIFTNQTIIFLPGPDIIEKYAKYIDDSFSNNVLAADFKDNIIFSHRILNLILTEKIFHSDNLCDVKLVVSLFVSPEKKTDIKNMFLELFRDEITSGRLHPFNGNIWREFLIWCTDSNEQRVDDFMKSLQIDVVFEAAFSKCLKNVGIQGDGATSLKAFLIQYFKSKSMPENYIREKVEYYERMDAAEVERIFGKDKQNVIDSIKNYLLQM